MKTNPRFVLLNAVCRYLTDVEQQILLAELTKEKPNQDRKFLRIIKEHFDFERMKDKPVFKEDVLLYNYLLYDSDESKKLKRTRLIILHENKFPPEMRKDIMDACMVGK